MGFFDWLRYGISHGYETGSNCADCPHYAVDIGTPYHTPITALWSGTVTSQRTGLPWGTEVFVKPDNGLPTYYYYHLDQLNTSVGQHLNAGDVIGLSGGQNSGGSNPSSSTYSLFLLALSLLGFGFYLLFQKQVNEAVKKTGSVAVKAAVL